MSARFAWVLLLAWGCQAPKPSVPAAASVRSLGRLESRFVAPRQVDVWLPPGYDSDSAARYAVLYMHDGQNLFDPGLAFGGEAWEVDDSLAAFIGRGQLRPCIVVGIWNTPKRFAEYMPAKPFAALSEAGRQSRYEEFGQGEPLSDAYLRFLTEELKPVIDSQFRTLPGPSDCFVMGSSMGGLMSLYAAWERPDVFGAAACLSTHWPGSLRSNDPDFTEAFISYLKARQPAAAPRLYFDYGTEALDARYELHQLRIDAALDSLGIARQTRRFDGASHNEASWRARLAAPLGFLLGKEAL